MSLEDYTRPNPLNRVFNPPPGWPEATVAWQTQSAGWLPPSADWVPTDTPGAPVAPAGWSFWVPNPARRSAISSALLRQALITLGIGVALVAAGLIATWVAQQFAGSGGFIVFTGLMLVGVFRIVVGVVQVVRIPFKTAAEMADRGSASRIRT